MTQSFRSRAIRNAAKTLREDISRGVIEPGVWLREQELADRFHISRASVREVFAALRNAGLIEVIPNRGARVVQLDAKSIEELFEIRGTLFGLCARFAAINMTARDVAMLKEEVEKLKPLLTEDGSPMEHIAGSFACARIVADACGNIRARQLITDFMWQGQWHFSYLGVSTLERRQESYANWSRLVELLHERNAGGAEQLARAMVRSSQQLALQLLKNDPDAYFKLPEKVLR